MGKGHRKRFGQRIRALRLAKGFTQESLAAAAGLHPTYIGGIERGERNVGLDNIIKLANALAIPPSEIFDEIGS
jgi:transcriptional regulator with XRE-family HTH domain